MPIKFFEQLKEKSRRKKEGRGQEPKRKSNDEKKRRQKKPKGKKNERRGSNIFKRPKHEQMPRTGQEATYLNGGEDVLFIENDRPNNNKYGNLNSNFLTKNIALTGDGDTNLNNVYANPDPELDSPKNGVEIKAIANDDKSPALVEHEVDAKEEELPEIRNISPVANNGLHKLPSMCPETQPRELGALSKSPPTSNLESKQTEPTPLSKAVETATPSVNELSTNNIHASGEVEAKSSDENPPKSKTPKGPDFSAFMPTSAPSLVKFKSSEHNEPLKASETSASTDKDLTPQNILDSLTKTSNQNQMPKPKPIVGILKKTSSPIVQSPGYVSRSAQSIKNSPQNTRPSDAENRTEPTKPKLDGVDDKPNRYCEVKKLWEQESNINSYVHYSKATPRPCVSNAVSASRSDKKEAAAASLMTANVAKAQPTSKQSNNGKPKIKSDADSNSTTSSSSDNSDVSSSSSTSSSSSSDSSDSNSWSTSDSSDSESDSSSSSSSTSSDSDSDSDFDFDTTTSSSSSTNTSEIVVKNAKVIAQKNRYSKFKEERF
ncbi:hypothetical protein ACTXT7_016637 [Hymenolepis weldensis]